MNPISKIARVLSQSRFQTRGESDRAFLQQRCALFAKVAFFISSAYYVLGLIVFLARTGDVGAWGDDPRAVLGLLNPSLLLIWWLVFSRGRWSHLALNLGDGAMLLMASIVMALLAREGDNYMAPGALVAGFGTALSFRATIIPSTTWRTAVTGLLCLVPVGWAIAFPSSYIAGLESASDTVAAAARSVASPWLLMSIALSVITSRIIYGLRRDVEKAKTLGQYRLDKKLGAGGMGEVYRASHAMLRRPTAIKLIRPEVAGEDALARFESEVQMTASLTHPNTIAIYDYGRTPDRVFYYAMEFLEGVDLQELVDRNGPLPAARAIHLLRQACGSLEEAHQMGLVHRDVKPANLFLTKRGGVPDVVKVLDFGLVKSVEQQDVQLTAPQSMVGTPLYLAPETIRGEDIGPPVDQYALGAVAYFLLTGSPVFEASTTMELCARHLESEPVSLARRLGHPVPDDLEQVVLKALAKNPADRHLDLAAFADALDGCSDAQGWSRERAEAWWARNAAEASPEASAAAASYHSLDDQPSPTVMIDPETR